MEAYIGLGGFGYIIKESVEKQLRVAKRLYFKSDPNALYQSKKEIIDSVLS
jgi:hypothetical protein